jgi:hypothetical protein
MYYTHHEGLDGAERMLDGKIATDNVTGRFEANVSDPAKRAALVQANGGSESAAYTAWLKQYTADHIVPANFRGTPHAS